MDFQSQSHDSSPLQKALKHASETVFYAPMVCMMFVGFRMRVLQLSKGTGDPQDWVRFSMQAVTYSILANTLLVLLVPLFSASEVELEKETGELKTEAKNPFENPMLATIFTVIRYLSFLGLYVGFACVCTGVFLYEPPAGVWDGPLPPLSPAVKCTMVLSTTFFMIYLLHAISRSYSQFAQGHLFTSTFEKVMMRAADTLGMAPMLCILFLAARMRALQMDPVGGNPQKWAQNCFFVCTYSLIAQTLFAVIVPLVLKGDVPPDLVYSIRAQNSGARIYCNRISQPMLIGREKFEFVVETFLSAGSLGQFAQEYAVLIDLVAIVREIRSDKIDGECARKMCSAICNRKPR